MSDAVQKLIDYCLRAQEKDLYVALLGSDIQRNAFLYNLKGLAHAAQEQLTQQAENGSKPEVANADEIQALRDDMYNLFFNYQKALRDDMYRLFSNYQKGFRSDFEYLETTLRSNLLDIVRDILIRGGRNE